MSKNQFEKDYKKLLIDVSCNGIIKPTRTGVDAISAFNKSLTIDLTQGFPILTGRKIFFYKGYHEYMWIREGLTTTTYLHNHGIKWWDSYADAKGNLGKTYGYQAPYLVLLNEGYIDPSEKDLYIPMVAFVKTQNKHQH